MSSNIEYVIGDISKEDATRHSLKQVCNFMAFVSKIKAKNFNHALINEHWLLAMQEELNKFKIYNI